MLNSVYSKSLGREIFTTFFIFMVLSTILLVLPAVVFNYPLYLGDAVYTGFLLLFFLLFLSFARTGLSLGLTFTIIAIYKLLVFYYLYFYYSVSDQEFFLNTTGDDHYYSEMSDLYSGDIDGLIAYRSGDYGLPFAIVATVIKSIYPSDWLIRCFNYSLSLVGALYFYELVVNIGKPKSVARLGMFIYGINPGLTITSAFVFKDTIITTALTMLLAILTRPKLNLLSIGSLIAVLGLFRIFLIPALVVLYFVNFATKLSVTKKIMIFPVLLLTGLLLGYQTIVYFSLGEMFSYRYSSFTDQLTVSRDIPWYFAIAPAFLSPYFPPVNILDFGSAWFSQEVVYGCSRVVNSFMLSLVIYNFFFKRASPDLGLLMLYCFISLGMVLLAQIFSDRHEAMISVVLIGMLISQLDESYKVRRVPFVGFCAVVVALQFVFVIMRAGS